jgi:hypothetical protein
MVLAWTEPATWRIVTLAAHGGGVYGTAGVIDGDVAAHGLGMDERGAAHVDGAAHGGEFSSLRGVGYVDIATHLMDADGVTAGVGCGDTARSNGEGGQGCGCGG